MQASRAFVLAAAGSLILSHAVVTARTVGAAGPQAPAKPAAGDSRWELRGVVVTELGSPVAHATVTARGSEVDQSVETAADGTFSMTIPQKSRLSGLVDATDKTGGLLGFVLLHGRADQPRPMSLRLVMKKPREIAVTVSDASDKPVARALVAAFSRFRLLGQQETDGAGKTVLRLPAGLPLQNVFAMKRDAGFDYVNYARSESNGSSKRDAAEANNDLKFKLTGARTVTVHVTDGHGKPVAGARVNPWYFEVPTKGDFNMSGEEFFAHTTDVQGNASFAFIPSDNQGKIVFSVEMKDRVVLDRPMFDPKSKSGEITAALLPLERVRGKVTTADGHPAAAAQVRASGVGYEIDDFHGSATSDAKGEFEMGVAPNKYCTFAARRGNERSNFEERIVRAGMPVEPVALVLKPGTRVSGRLTRAKDRSPVSHQTVTLQAQFDNAHRKLTDDQRLPNPKGSRRWIGSHWSEFAQTDSDGRFEFLVPPGRYTLAWSFPSQQVEVKDQQPVVVNLVDTRPDRSPLKGRVVLKSDPSHGVSGASVEGVNKDPNNFLNRFRVVADQNGNFEASRGETNMVIWAHSGNLAGAVSIKPGDKTVVVQLGPTASAAGTLVDDATGKSAAKKMVSFGVRLPEKGGPFSWSFGQSALTDANGRFAVEGLTVGLKYDVHAEMERNAEGPFSWHTVAEVVPKNADRIDLGELRLPAPYKPPTLEQLIQRAMKSKKPLDARLESGLTDARLFENRVLIFAAAPKSAACKRFFSILYARNSREGEDEAREALGNVTRLAIDSSAHERAADLKTFLARWDLGPPAPDDAILAVIDRDGRLVATTTDRQLSLEKNKGAKALAAFLRKHEGPVPDAEKRLADALAQARRENKCVLVEQSAAWCSWCHVLAKFLDSHRSLIEKDYVWVIIDPRFTHGDAVIKKLRPKAEGGIPWMVILDADSKPLITSDSPEGNIGYPGEPKEREHFEKMLRTTARHLSDTEIKLLLADAAKR